MGIANRIFKTRIVNPLGSQQCLAVLNKWRGITNFGTRSYILSLREAKGDHQPSMPWVALANAWPPLGGVLIHATNIQTHTKTSLKGIKPSQAVMGHQAPDISVEECTKCSSGKEVWN